MFDSKKERLVIIGAIAAGTSAAAKARRKNEDIDIVLYEKDKYISYGTCGLPYFVSGKIERMNKLLVNTVKLFEKRFNLKVNARHEVLKIDTDNKRLSIKNLKTGEIFEDYYDKLIITSGSKPIVPSFKGAKPEDIFNLKTIEDSLKLKKKLEGLESEIKKSGKDKKAVIIGGGFIGLELLEAFVEKGLKVTIIEKMEQILPMFDVEVIEYLHNYLLSKDIELSLCDEVDCINVDDNKKMSVKTACGNSYDADLIFCGIGTRPDATLAKEAGIPVDERGLIVVDEKMQTPIKDIYAAGDCCQCINTLNDDVRSFNLASIANRQGRVAGYNCAGGSDTFKGSTVTSIIKVLDIAISKTGLSLKDARKAGFDSAKVELHALSHAGYYPGAEMIHMICIFDKKTSRLLGFEAISKQGADKKTDVMALAIKNNMKLEDLANLDLCYQPEFGSAKDPLNILGMIGENMVRGEVEFIDVEELKELLQNNEKVQIIDVRTEKEYNKGHIQGAKLIPVDDIRDRLDELDKKKKIVVHCRTSYRSYLAYRILKNNGFSDVKNLNGSYWSWTRKI